MDNEKNEAEPSGASGGSARHAPGPWVVVQDRHGDLSVHQSRNGRAGVEVAEVSVDCDSLRERANATLIAAAPEMLAALQQIAAIQLGRDGDCGAARIAEDAIAKALGQ